MNNATIIFSNQIELMNQGIIGTTGRTLKLMDGTTMPEPEPIHTFSEWKALGYSVKKGQHAIATFKIWKLAPARQRTIEQSNGEEAQYEEEAHFYQTKAFWFKRDQVEPITQ